VDLGFGFGMAEARLDDEEEEIDDGGEEIDKGGSKTLVDPIPVVVLNRKDPKRRYQFHKALTIATRDLKASSRRACCVFAVSLPWLLFSLP